MSKPNKKVLLRIAVGFIAIIGLSLIAQDELNDPYVREVIKKLQIHDDIDRECTQHMIPNDKYDKP